ncbi:MAG: Eco57I restriction-modification methylase domain-containing protein [Sulfuritalea sp.]|nr:Eco57I restriction-modification methylase domain-containing protein [Sulfuritalea sp.]MDP1982211.1 Eco57I restriction-modification methylase domain-containing protein [Sulfuritalea sp.]
MHAIQSIDTRRENVAALIPPTRKSEFGQFMTSSRIASFMAEMFEDFEGRDIRLLDAGAGIGSLAAAFAQRAAKEHPTSTFLSSWEIDPTMREHLAETLDGCLHMLSSSDILAETEIHPDDFILDACRYIGHMQPPRFTHAILNPPYRKLNSQSMHRKMLRTVDIETTNLYAAFVALSMLMLEERGELVAITPRSFCNGAYFKPFRKMLLQCSAIRRVHVFDSRNHAFRGDDVLQENIIFHLVKGAPQGDVILSSSGDASFSDLTEKSVPFARIVGSNDEERIIHLPTGDKESELDAMMLRFPFLLGDLGIGVSTGPVVDFRMKPHLRESVTDGSVPLIYCLNFSNGFVSHPRLSRKPPAIAENDETAKWLMPSGHYVLVRRLSSKEEKRRLVPAVFDPARVSGRNIGFENHLNVFHENKRGMPPLLAKGLAVYLGSTFSDKWFRRFNGHTQVNAGDLRALRYPSRATLESWGRNIGDEFPSQEAIDAMVEG